MQPRTRWPQATDSTNSRRWSVITTDGMLYCVLSPDAFSRLQNFLSFLSFSSTAAKSNATIDVQQYYVDVVISSNCKNVYDASWAYQRFAWHLPFFCFKITTSFCGLLCQMLLWIYFFVVYANTNGPRIEAEHCRKPCCGGHASPVSTCWVVCGAKWRGHGGRTEERAGSGLLPPTAARLAHHKSKTVQPPTSQRCNTLFAFRAHATLAATEPLPGQIPHSL